MERYKEDIIRALNEELAYSPKDSSYRQWVLGISIASRVEDGDSVHIVRVVVKTNKSPYVDGMDIVFTEIKDAKGDITVEMDPSFYEHTPELQGSEVEHALAWLQEDDREVIHLKVEIPGTSGREHLWID